MRNVSDAGVEALAEAGCGCGLRTLILGAVWQCPFRSCCGCLVALRHSHMFLLGGVLFACFFFVVALPPDVLVATNGGVAGVV